MEHSGNVMLGSVLFGALALFRYARPVVGAIAYNTYQPKPVLASPTFTGSEVSVIIPTTFKKPDELVHCISRIISCAPKAVYVVTAHVNVQLVKDLCALQSFGDSVHVLGVEVLNKRAQILCALKEITTPITVLADDDVFWPENYLPYLLAIFEDKEVGAGGTRQRVQRMPSPTAWNFLGISYLERRVFNNCATNAIDGGLSTLSGRTAAYRTSILKTPEFENYFTTDSWRGKPLNSDDDKCLTRYVYSKGWKIALQFDKNSIIETTVESDWKYLSQCMRWARAHWRGNFTVMENETYWRSSSMLWTFYYVYLGQFQTPSVIVDALLFLFLSMALGNSSVQTARTAYACLGFWIFFTKIMKLIPHFLRHPSDMRFIPLSIAFSYFHGLLNIYAAFSMQVTHWGSQDLKTLGQARAVEEDVVSLLHDTVEKADGESAEPKFDSCYEGDDFFDPSEEKSDDEGAEKIVAEEEDPVAEQDGPVAGEEDPVSGEDDLIAEAEDPVAEQDHQVAGAAETEDPVAGEEDSVAEQDDPVAAEDDPVAVKKKKDQEEAVREKKDKEEAEKKKKDQEEAEKKDSVAEEGPVAYPRSAYTLPADE